MVINLLVGYPEDGNHLELVHDIEGLEIIKGYDTLYFGENLQKYTRPNKWYIYNKDNDTFEHEKYHILGGKGFKTSEDAYAYAKKSYIRHLKFVIKVLQTTLVLMESK